MNKIVLGVCGGGGILLHPFKEVLLGNIEPRGAYHDKADYFWNQNFSGVPLHRDIEEYKGKKPKVIIGHPDCGSGSVLSYSRAKKLRSIKDNLSFIKFVEAVNLYKPDFFLFENLEALFKNYSKDRFIKIFKGYYIIFKNVSVARFGNSQKNRVRLIAIGIKVKLKNKYKNNFKIPTEPRRLRTCEEIEAGLDLRNTDLSNGEYREPLNQLITMYGGYKTSLRAVKKYWLDNPDQKRFKAIDRKYTNAPGVYRNLGWSLPATARKQNRQFNRIGEMMSPRQLARIQGIPDSFNLSIRSEKLKYDLNKWKVICTKCPPYELGQWYYNTLINLKLYG